jgi:phosphatidylinositol alpha 1,6-mannosyltransferase
VLTAFAPDVVHLASPIALGAQGALVAQRLGIPAVAVYQTDIAAFAQRYHLGATRRVIWAWLRQVHERCARTLAPSSPALWDLRRNGIPNVHLWGRGVDGEAFDPAHRSEALRKELAPNGEVLVGYVGRLGAEKRVELLAPLASLPGTRVVVVGDGPARKTLEQQMPSAAFLGFQHGPELSATFASLDVFVHPGDGETFCQAAQEALCSGVPVVAAAAGGLLDLVRHGETGLLWPPDQPEELTKAVATLVDDPQLRATLGANARPSVAGRTWEALGDQILGHYQAVIGHSGREAVAS